MIESLDGVLVVFCDTCDQPIADLSGGMAFYNMNVKRSPVRFAHKGACDEALGGTLTHPTSIELAEFPFELADELGAKRDAAR